MKNIIMKRKINILINGKIFLKIILQKKINIQKYKIYYEKKQNLTLKKKKKIKIMKLSIQKKITKKKKIIHQ